MKYKDLPEEKKDEQREKARARRAANLDRHKATTKKWKDKNKERLKAYNNMYYQAHPDIRRWRTEWNRANKDLSNNYSKNNRARLKYEVLSIYGGVCAACGFSDVAALSIDHVNGDGYVERKTLEGYSFYSKLRIDFMLGKPNRRDLRVLCMTCQWMAKAYGSNTEKWPSSTMGRRKEQQKESPVRIVFSWVATDANTAVAVDKQIKNTPGAKTP